MFFIQCIQVGGAAGKKTDSIASKVLQQSEWSGNFEPGTSAPLYR